MRKAAHPKRRHTHKNVKLPMKTTLNSAHVFFNRKYTERRIENFAPILHPQKPPHSTLSITIFEKPPHTLSSKFSHIFLFAPHNCQRKTLIKYWSRREGIHYRIVIVFHSISKAFTGISHLFSVFCQEVGGPFSTKNNNFFRDGKGLGKTLKRSQSFYWWIRV